MPTLKLPTTKTQFARTARDYIIMVFGPPGVGKTSFVNQFGDVLFLSTDRGTRFQSAMREECLTWKKFDQVADSLEQPNAPKYDFICIDHVDDFANMAEEAVCKEMGIASLGDAGYAKGWRAYRQKIERFVRRIMRLGTGICFIAHEEIKTVKTRSIELQRTMPMLSKTAWKVIVPLADVVAYAGYRTVIVEKPGKPKKRKEIRTIESDPREDLYAKDRTQRHKPSRGWDELDGKKFLDSFTYQPELEEAANGQGQEQQEGEERPRGRRARK